MVGLVDFRCCMSDGVSVIAEPLNDDGTMRADVFYNTLGTSYINIALQTAHAADPNAKLYINDYNLEYAGEFERLPLCIFCDANGCLPYRPQNRCHGPTCRGPLGGRCPHPWYRFPGSPHPW